MTLVEIERGVAALLDQDAEQTSRAVRAFLGLLGERLAAGEAVKLQGFGRFEVRLVEARRRKDPRNGRDIDVPSKMRISFKPSRLLNESINKGGAEQAPAPGPDRTTI